MRDKISSIVREVTSSSSQMSEPQQFLEVATRIMQEIQIPQHQQEVGLICDAMTQLAVKIAGPEPDPEKLAPEQLARVTEGQ